MDKGVFLRRGSLEEKNESFCPDESKLVQYLEDSLSQDRRERICEHILSCDSCFKKVADAEKTFSSFEEKEPERPPAHVEKRAKMIARKLGKTAKIKNHFKKNRFLYFSVVSLIFSFIFKRYFVQFLAIATVLGFKWVMDTGGAKALIMIYDTWRISRENKN